MQTAGATTELWIVIPRWEEFQHPDTTRTGNIPWVKNFTRLLSDDAYLNLNASERAVLHGLWLEYARSRAGLRLATSTRRASDELDTSSLTRRLNLRVTQKTLERLNHAGFIQFSASRPASSLASRTASADEKRPEEKRQEALNQEPLPTATVTEHRDPERDGGNTNGLRSEPLDEAALERVADLVSKAAPGDIQW